MILGLGPLKGNASVLGAIIPGLRLSAVPKGPKYQIRDSFGQIPHIWILEPWGISRDAHFKGA